MKKTIFASITMMALLAGCASTNYQTCYGHRCMQNCELSLKLCNCNSEDCKYKHKECLKACDAVENRTLKHPDSDMKCE
jgi:hypothetical protein